MQDLWQGVHEEAIISVGDALCSEGTVHDPRPNGMRGDAKSEHFQRVRVALLAACGAIRGVQKILVIEKPIDAAVAMHALKIWKSVLEL